MYICKYIYIQFWYQYNCASLSHLLKLCKTHLRQRYCVFVKDICKNSVCTIPRMLLLVLTLLLAAIVA